MDMKEIATDAWTKLVIALREDGLIAHCVTQSGPHTTNVIMELAIGKSVQTVGGWLTMDIHPESGRAVVARDYSGQLHILHHDTSAKSWFKGKARTRAENYKQWRYVD